MTATTTETSAGDRTGLPRCEHFETRGVILAELGEPDVHPDGCPPCRALRDRHRVLAAALGSIGDDRGPPSNWQAQVWARIDREDSLARQRRSYGIGASAAAMIAVAAALVLWFRTGAAVDGAPRIEIVAGETAMRSTSARVGDRIRVRIGRDAAVWLYREDRVLVGRCDRLSPGPRCAPSADGLVLELELAAPGRYQVVVVTDKAPAPTGSLDRDVAAASRAGLAFRLTEIDVW